MKHTISSTQFCLFQNSLSDLLTSKRLCSTLKKILNVFAQKTTTTATTTTTKMQKLFWTTNSFFSGLRMYFYEMWYLRWSDGCLLHLKHISLGLTFIIDFPSIYNGLKHLCSLKLISILQATWWKVVMKWKIVMFFILFGLFFSNHSFLRFQNFISPSIKYPVNLIFSVVVCICKIQTSLLLMGNFNFYQ